MSERNKKDRVAPHRQKWPIGTLPARRWLVIEFIAASDLSEKCYHLRQAFERLEEAARLGPQGHPPNAAAWTRGIWMDVIGILDAYSAITHTLWPIPSPHRGDFEREVTVARGRMLRQRLRVSDERPPVSRAVRNAFEHTDERLDDWVLDQPWPDDIPPTMPISWSVSGSRPELEPVGHNMRGFRYINVRTMDVRIGDQWVRLDEILRLSESILSKIPKELQVHWGEAEFEPGPLVPAEPSQPRTGGGQDPPPA